MTIRSNSLNDVNSKVANPVLEKAETGIETEKVTRVVTPHFSDSEEEGFVLVERDSSMVPKEEKVELINRVDLESDSSMLFTEEELETEVEGFERIYVNKEPVQSRYKMLEKKIEKVANASIEFAITPIISFLEKTFPLPEDNK